MRHALLLLTTLTVTGLVACASNSGDTSAPSTAAAAYISFTAVPATVAPGGTSTLTFAGGSNVFQNPQATQGTIQQIGPTTFRYTAPASPTSSITTITVTDSTGFGGTAAIMVTNAVAGGGTATAANCAGQYTVTAAGLTATLGIVRNVGGQISGFLYFPPSSVNPQPYVYPIWGSCNQGQISFQNMSLGQTYTGAFAASGTSLVAMNGTVTTSAGAVSWSATSNSVSQAPVAETMACGGTYTANIAGTIGTLALVHNGGGGVAGYLRLVAPDRSVNVYSLTGTCGATITLTNNTNQSRYTGTATFNGNTVQINGSFVTAAGASHAWSASK